MVLSRFEPVLTLGFQITFFFGNSSYIWSTSYTLWCLRYPGLTEVIVGARMRMIGKKLGLIDWFQRSLQRHGHFWLAPMHPQLFILIVYVCQSTSSSVFSLDDRIGQYIKWLSDVVFVMHSIRIRTPNYLCSAACTVDLCLICFTHHTIPGSQIYS